MCRCCIVWISNDRKMFKYLHKIFGENVVVFKLRPQKGPAHVTALPLRQWQATLRSTIYMHKCELIFYHFFKIFYGCCLFFATCLGWYFTNNHTPTCLRTMFVKYMKTCNIQVYVYIYAYIHAQIYIDFIVLV